MTDKDKGVILVNKNMKDLSGLNNFNRVWNKSNAIS
jgi:hypothetical protein